MRAVGLKVLKNKLSEYVRLAAGGETVLVTDRDRVVAELVPPRAGRSSLLSDAMLADAVRNGWITPPVRPKRRATATQTGHVFRRVDARIERRPRDR
jgi:antitoxin (DNA-binding transcriptional repressor) of toxin-antitoxin stability system